ncbi:MAG: hypothetical protein WDN04_21175 [Rhodospirillales bacterium]
MAVEEVTPDVAACRVLGISFSDLGIGVAKTWGFPERMMRCMDASSPRLAGKPKSYDETLHSTTLMAQDIAGKVIASHDADPKLVAAGAFDTYKRQLPLDSRAFGAAMGVAMEKFTEYARAVSFPIKKNPTALRIAKTLSGPTQLITQPGFAAGAAGAPATPCAAAPSASLSAQPCISVAGALLPDSPAVDAPAAGELLSAGIQDLSNAIVEERPLSDVLRIMLEAMYRAMGFRNIVLAVRDARQQEIAGRFGLGPDVERRVKALRFPVAYAADVFHVAMERNLDIVIADTSDAKIADKLPEWYRKGIAAPTFMLFPLIVKKTQFGMVYADQGQANAIRISEADPQAAAHLAQPDTDRDTPGRVARAQPAAAASTITVRHNSPTAARGCATSSIATRANCAPFRRSSCWRRRYSRYASCTRGARRPSISPSAAAAPRSAILPLLATSCGWARACASTMNCTMNSMSIMPPASCLRSNSPLRLGCAARIFSRMAAISAASGALARSRVRMARRVSSNARPRAASPAHSRARVNAWCSHTQA